MSLAKLLAAPALLAALAAAVPAAAAPFTDGNALRRDIAQLDRQIDRLQDRRAISGREAAQLDGRVRTLDQTWRAYSRGGFSQAERRNLSAQILRVQRDIERRARDRNNRYARNDWNDRAPHRR